MPATACPNSATLTAFVRGALPEAELVRVAEHLDRCPACSAALQAAPEGSLAGLAREAAAADTIGGSARPHARADLLGQLNETPAGFDDHPRYRILSRLGAGGMGTVYKAEDLLMGRVIAIKVVSPHLTAKATAVERFRKEVRAAAQLNHPSVITAHDTGEAGGSQFLVMEFVEGVSLDRLVAKKGPLAVPLACGFIRHAALGLQHAADKGMVHRDIKPHNIMVTRKGQVKVLDFGLARFVCGGTADEGGGGRLPFGAGKALAAAGLTNPNVLMGTPDYLSPEQARNSHEVDHRSDVYSLGCTLYFLLTGRTPFAAAESLLDKLLAHTHEEPTPVTDLRPDVPPEVAAILARMMAKNPDARYQTAGEAAADLLPFMRGDAPREPVVEVIEATPAPRPVRFEPLAPADPGYTPVDEGPTLADAARPKRPRKPKRAPKSWWRRWRGAVARGAVAALLLIVAVAVAPAARKAVTERRTDPNATAKASQTDKADAPADKGDKGDKGNKAPADDKAERPGKGEAGAPPTVVAPPALPRGPQVLFVIPSDGVSLDEFVPVRDRLIANGVRVVVAAHEGTRSRPARVTPGAPVPIDVHLRGDMDLTDYAAVLFCGERIEEYVLDGRGSLYMAKLLKRAYQEYKVAGAIGVGQGVMALHGAFKGCGVAPSKALFDRYPQGNWNARGIVWGNVGVIVDNKLVTASGPRDAVEFADAVSKLIGAR